MNKVLIVDDEPYVLEGLRLMIDWAKYGFELCGEAADGEEAYEIMRRIEPDLVITDIDMPYMNGLSLIRRTLAESNYRPKFVILSAHADFVYVQTAIRYKVNNYIQKPIITEEVEEVLYKLSQEIAEERKQQCKDVENRKMTLVSTISKWIRGENIDEITPHVSEWLGLKKPTSFRILLVELEMDEHAPVRVISKSVMEQIGEQLSTTIMSWCSCSLFNEPEGRIGILLVDGPTIRRTLESHLSKFATWVRSSYQLDISFYISGQGYGISELHELYKQALHARVFRISMSKAGVFFFVPQIKSTLFSDTLNKHIEILIDLVKRGFIGELTGQISLIFVEFSKMRVDYQDILNYIMMIRSQLIDTMLQWNDGVDIPVGVSSIHVEGPVHITELRRYLVDMCIATVSKLQELKKEKFGSDPLYELIEYVKENYNQKLKLQDLADQFNMNPVYLGQYFKKNKGMTFNVYIHHLRIEEAKKLLRRTDLKIEYIAKKVGYSDTEYFVEKFKGLTDCIPSIYKKNNS
ncbi:response regulator transcription factor [Paenibacillus sp. FA6]|uniref:response regulator transcription factor n=1 Tax=Paenibacillus sp. FA6 TaxID=3413029 RepID=UPI003F65F87D